MSPFSSDILQPLRQPLFRRIWSASLLSNLGILIQGVGAAWAMTQLTDDPQMVALVQTALMLPIMLLSLGAGAAADMYDRRRVAMGGLSVALAGATLLTILTFADLLSPPILLFFCFSVGSGMALFGPAWQASVPEQVPRETLPNAVALVSISFNVARSFGPAIGGAIVAAGGAVAAFLINALCYLPLLVVLHLWKRPHEVPRLPPERLFQAISSGLRYVLHAPDIRTILVRTVVMGLCAGSIQALLPLVSRDLLGGSASTYGLMLGCYGMGAVLGALNFSRIRERFSNEMIIRLSGLVVGTAVAILAISPWIWLSGLALTIAGLGFTAATTLFNVSVQLSAPRWVAGRALASFAAAIAGGIAVGSWAWGAVADEAGVSGALLLSAGTLLLSPLMGRHFRMPTILIDPSEAAALSYKPKVALALTRVSGPIRIEIEYRIDPDEARQFYTLLQELAMMRRRNGAQDWSLARDIADPMLWKERYRFPTWLDYLRHSERPTAAERELTVRARAMAGEGGVKVRRFLERPFGSVRWSSEAPDRGDIDIIPPV